MPGLRRLALLFAAALALAAGPAAAEIPVGPADMVLGDPKARVTVIEYASLSCPHCARFNSDVFPAFKKKYVDTGKVRYVFREFLTQPAEVAAVGALIARCAGPKGFFKVVDAYFEGLADIYAEGKAREVILKAGAAGGLDEKKVNACLADKAAQTALYARVKTYSEQEKIEATPTFLIGGKRLEGEQTLEQLDAVIGPLLAK